LNLALFDGIFGPLCFKSMKGGFAGEIEVGLGSWIIAKGELGLDGKPSAISFGTIMKK
jgi:hypothetical protein